MERSQSYQGSDMTKSWRTLTIFSHRKVLYLMASQGFLFLPVMHLPHSIEENSAYPLKLVKMSPSLYEVFSMLSFGFPLPSLPLIQHLSQSALNFSEYTSAPCIQFWAPWGQRWPLIHHRILSIEPTRREQHLWSNHQNRDTVLNTLYTLSHLIPTKLSKVGITLLHLKMREQRLREVK